MGFETKLDQYGRILDKLPGLIGTTGTLVRVVAALIRSGRHPELTSFAEEVFALEASLAGLQADIDAFPAAPVEPAEPSGTEG